MLRITAVKTPMDMTSVDTTSATQLNAAAGPPRRLLWATSCSIRFYRQSRRTRDVLCRTMWPGAHEHVLNENMEITAGRLVPAVTDREADG
jgi:hypothetical protein